MNKLPAGNLTFLFSKADVISKPANEFPDKIHDAQNKLHDIIMQAVTSNNGNIFKRNGDDYCCSFEKAADSVKAAVEIQQEISSENLQNTVFRTRIGIHSGAAEWTGNDYKGYVTLARTNRIMSSANPDQILVSNVTYELVRYDLPGGISFRDLGERRLKDLQEALRLFQVNADGLVSEFPPLKTLDERQHNLPVELTNFIGREKEMTELKKLLNTSRLVTILGPGGTGKSRLAIQLGAEKIDEYENGVRLIELASLTDPLLIYNTIAGVFNLTEEGSEDPECLVNNFLKEKNILLIFDNCEHLINDCAVICSKILSNSPDLNIMTTSREVLGIEGEMIYHLPTLSMPDPDDELSEESINRFESVRLFTDRAVALKNDFTVTNENCSAIAMICFHLDGIPLAIELAAARVKILKPEKILENISNRFRFLTGGSRISLPRQQTLKAMIDWSFDLLSEKEKILFRNLSVFSGGWSLEAAEEICAADGIETDEILDLISNLSNKSIIFSKEKNGIIRYNMLETIREYSCELLTEKSELSDRHFRYFLKLSENNNSELNNEREKARNNLMFTESDNFRAALKWSLENSLDESADLIINLTEFWESSGNYSTALEYIKKILKPEIKLEESKKATVLLNAAYLICQLGDNKISEKYILESLEYFRKKNDHIKIAEALSVYGLISYVNGEPLKAEKIFKEGLSVIENKNMNILESELKNNLATVYSGTGNIEEALKLLEQSIEIQRKFNKRNLLAKSLLSKGGAYLQTGSFEEAKKCIEESLELLKEFDDQYSTATALYNLGNLNFAVKDFPEAVIYFGKAVSVAEEYGLSGVLDRSKIKLGEIYLTENENEKARNIFIESLKSFSGESEKLKLNLSVYGLGKYFFFENDFEKSAKFFLLSERINDQINFRFSKARTEEYTEIMKKVRSKINQDRFKNIQKEVFDYDIGNAAEISIALANEN